MAKPTNSLGLKVKKAPAGAVECLGQTFEDDNARRTHFLGLLREKLKDPEFRKEAEASKNDIDPVSAAELEKAVLGALRAGDAVIFDDRFVHRTGVGAGMCHERYAIESWFFAASVYPAAQLPITV